LGNLALTKELVTAVSSYEGVQPARGLAKSLGCVGVIVSCAYLAVTGESLLSFLFFGSLASITIAMMMILTHDALHHTLTGCVAYDEVFPRIVSWVFVWPHGLYSQVHKLHHNMNGHNLNDPERIHFTEEEYAAARPLKQFYLRHIWVINILLFSGLGMIYKTTFHAIRLRDRSQAIRTQLLMDGVGILFAQMMIYSIMAHFGLGLKYFAFWFLSERISGAIIQFRAHVEHFGLWGKRENFLLTQAYNCRNVECHPLASWFFNGLNYHSVHHMFPKIPFYHLKQAHFACKDILNRESMFPLPLETSYLSAFQKHS
jgi:fatty acid desaturase